MVAQAVEVEAVEVRLPWEASCVAPLEEQRLVAQPQVSLARQEACPLHQVQELQVEVRPSPPRTD